MSAGARLRAREVARRRLAAGAVRVPGALPPDGETLARDLGACEACGRFQLLAPGSPRCSPCEAQARAAATRGNAL